MRKRKDITELQYDKYVDALRKQIADGVSPFENDSPEKQAARIKRCEDPLVFMKTYMPHYFTFDFAPCHAEWCDISDQPGFNLIGAPRDHAKTTIITFGLRVYRICRQLRKYILLGSDTHEQAQRFGVSIKVELEDNPRLKHDYGDFIKLTSKKADDCFVTSGGTMVESLGRKDKWRGRKHGPYRPDDAALDDMENNQTVKNPDVTKDIVEFIQGEILGAVEADCSTTMIGNVFHGKSAIAQLIAMENEETGEKLYLSKIYDAIVDEDEKITLWPARWPWAKLDRKRQTVTTRIFNKEYRNKYTDEDSPFPEEKARYIEHIEVVNRKLIAVTAVDPSAKAAEQNDFRAVITFGLDPAKMVFICLHSWIKKRSIGEMFGAAYDQCDQYKSRVAVIEENMLKDFLHEAILNYAKKVGRYLPWKPINHSTEKIGRIVGTCEYLWEYGKLLFQKQQSDQELLKEQFVYLLNKNVHDDGPDAAEMAISELQSGCGYTTEYESVTKRAFGGTKGAW